MNAAKLLSLFLGMLLCLSLFVGCATPDNTDETTPPPAADTSAPEDTVALDAYGREIVPSALPEGLSFNGTTINFFIRADEEFVHEMFYDGGGDGDIISNAIYERNVTVQDQLKVVLQNTPTTGSYKEMHNVISTSNMAGDDEYQVCALHAGYSATGVTAGLYLNLMGQEHLHFDQPWWNSDFNDKATLHDQLYFCVGDLATTALTGIYVTFVNKAIASEFNVNVDDLYTTVQNGNWTYDKLLELTNFYVDDGNATRDLNDKYGFVVNTGTVIDPFTVCFDSQLITIHDDDTIEVTIYTEKMVDIVEKVYHLIFEHGGSYNHADRGYLQLARDVFALGNSLMMVNKMGFASTYLKDTTFDKAILPFPKYNAEQESYKSFSHNDHSVFSIPKTCQNIEATTAALELLNELSYKEVTPVIYEDALKIKYSADEVTASMLDIARAGLSFDSGWIYSNALGNIAQNTVRELMKDKSKDLASRYASLSTTLESNLTTLDTYLSEQQ